MRVWVRVCMRVRLLCVMFVYVNRNRKRPGVSNAMSDRVRREPRTPGRGLRIRDALLRNAQSDIGDNRRITCECTAIARSFAR